MTFDGPQGERVEALLAEWNDGEGLSRVELDHRLRELKATAEDPKVIQYLRERFDLLFFLPPGTKLENIGRTFEITKELTSGGFGTIYLAHGWFGPKEQPEQETVAVKAFVQHGGVVSEIGCLDEKAVVEIIADGTAAAEIKVTFPVVAFRLIGAQVEGFETDGPAGFAIGCGRGHDGGLDASV